MRGAFGRAAGGAFVIAASLAVVSACATGPGSASDPFAEPGARADDQLRIVAENQHFRDATLYARRSAARIRLGSVSGGSAASFSLDWPGTESLRIEIVMLGGDRYTTPSVLVSPGDRVRLRVVTPLRESRIRR